MKAEYKWTNIIFESSANLVINKLAEVQQVQFLILRMLSLHPEYAMNFQQSINY